MNEDLFQFLWQHSLYQAAGLTTQDGDTVTVITPGTRNRDSGPDFTEARIRLGNTLLVGNVELHLRTSDWLKHGHSIDPAYKNLVLHVVMEEDVPNPVPGTPLLVLKDRISAVLVARYSDLMDNLKKLPCAGHHNGVKFIIKEQWLSSLLAERWEQKLGEWNVLLQHTAEDWRNLLYYRMAANFGFKVNTEAFLMLAQSLPLNVIARHRDNAFQVEALVFGQSGFLQQTWEDKYPNDLRKEYDYLRKKYGLSPLPVHLWKFLRMRPANFPTIRLAQFSALLQQSVHLFSKIVETHAVRDILPLLEVTASEYWDTHYKFDEPQKSATKKILGITSVYNIIINTIAPIQFLYAARQGNYDLHEEALQLLENVPPEKNHIVEIWETNGWHASNAAHSQSLIQLYNQYCSKKRCLECAIGLQIFRLTK